MLESISGWRVVASAEALGALTGRVLRLAEDEALIIGGERPELADPDAIVVEDSGWMAVTLSRTELAALLGEGATWSLPEGDGLVQGMLLGVPVKISVKGEGAQLLVLATLGAELSERML